MIATGEKFKVEQDFIAGSSYGLSLQRSFNASATMFGPKWLSEYDYPQMTFSGCYRNPDYGTLCIPEQATFTLPDGSAYTYQRTSEVGGMGYRVKNSTAMGRMIYSPDLNWVLTRNNKTYTFSTTGVLQKIKSLGNVTVLQYTYGTDPLRPTRVTNAAGQTVDFTWSGNRVTTAKDPAGSLWTYGYNAGGMLTSVMSPGTSPDVRTYLYENAADATLLTGISINGQRYSTYAYYPDKRVQESGLAGGEERDTFTYATNQTTVTSAKGQPTTYAFASVQGARKLTAVSRASTASCAAASAQTVYDANGWVDYTVDFRGNVTDYQYDVSGKLLQQTVANGTSSANTRVNTWSGDNLTETTYRDAANTAYAKVSYSYVTTAPGTGNLATVTWTDLRLGGQRQTTYGYTFQPNGVLGTMTVTRALPAGGATTTYVYDTLGNLTSTTNAVGHQTTLATYNGLGLPGRVTDPNGVITDMVYDTKGNMSSTAQYVNGGARTTTYAYNNNRQVTDITYATGRIDRFRYTASTRLLSTGNALNEFVTYGFDVPSITATTSSNRNVPSLSGSTPVAYAAGQFSATERLDSLGRPLLDTGNAGQQVGFGYDGNGNVKSRADAAGHTTVFDYDPLDRLIKVTASDGGITTYTYNSEGRLATVNDPRSLPTQYTYNGLGQMLTQVSRDSGTTTYTYDTAGRLASKTQANGVTISYGWDSLDRPLSRSSGSVTQTLTYDEGTYGRGHLTRMNDATGQTTFTYSGAGELVQQSNLIYGSTFTTTWATTLPADWSAWAIPPASHSATDTTPMVA